MKATLSIKLVLSMLVISNFASAQTVGIAPSASTFDSKSILDIQSTTKGVLLPRMTAAQQNTMDNTFGTAQAGMVVYITDTGEYQYWDGTQWVVLLGAVDASNGLTVNGAGAVPDIELGGDLEYDTQVRSGSYDMKFIVNNSPGGGRVAIGSTSLVVDEAYSLSVERPLDNNTVKVGGDIFGVSISVDAGSERGLYAENTATAAGSSFYAIGAQLVQPSITNGYLGYHTTGDNSYAVYGSGGTFSGFFQGKVVVTSATSSTSVADLEVQNTTTGAGNAATLSLRQTTSNSTNGNLMGNINFGDNYSTGAQARIQVARGAAGGASDWPTNMIFSTTPDGSTTLTEGMRLSHGGNLGIGSTAPDDKLDVVGNTQVSGYLRVGSPSTPNIPAGYDQLYADDFEGDIFWSLDGSYGCGSSTTWDYILLTSGDLFTTALAWSPSALRSARRIQSPSIWIPTYYSSFYVTLNSRSIGTFDEPEDGVYLMWKDEGSTGTGTTWTKITSFAAGGYGTITAGSNTTCTGGGSQSGWHMNDKGTDYGSMYDQTSTISSTGRYIRLGLVGIEDNSAYDEDFFIYDVLIYGNRTALSSSFTAGSIYSEGPVYASVQYRLGDLAEYFEVDSKTEPGTLIAISANGNDSYSIADRRNPHLLLGVHSTAPTVTLNNPNRGVPVALAGRVPVKVNNENGPIRIGDYLSVSSVPGVACRALESGFVIGRALENSDNTNGLVLCMVETGWANVNSKPTTTSGGSFQLASGTDSVVVLDQSVTPDSRVFITFREFAGSEFRVGTIADGRFTVHLEEKSPNGARFDYFVDNAATVRPSLGNRGEVNLVSAEASQSPIMGQSITKAEADVMFPTQIVKRTSVQVDNGEKTAPRPPDPDQVWLWTADRGFFTMNDVRASRKSVSTH